MAIENFVSHSAPFGEALPIGNPHAVSASLPRLDDVRRLFRDHDAEAWASLQTTYPRFGDHPFIRQAAELCPINEGRSLVAFSSPQAAERLVDSVGPKEIVEPTILVDGTMTFLSFTPGTAETADLVKVAKKVGGGVPSSRRAEDFLIDQGILATPYEEVIDPEGTDVAVRQELQRIYDPLKPEVFLANSGMSAISAAIDALHYIRNRGQGTEETGRGVWVMLGNLYRDSEDLVIRRHEARKVKDVTDVAKIREMVEGQGERIAGLITEAPANPLLQSPDLEEVKAALGDIPLVVDVSTGGSIAVDAFPHADVVVESLTKFASGRGDLMMGAVIVNPDSRYADELHAALPARIEPPYHRDVARFSHELKDWYERAWRTGVNVLHLAEFFEGHPRIKAVHWAGSEKNDDGYARLARNNIEYPGLITVETKRALRPVYDALDLAKGPSFGTRFTLNTDFTGIVYPQEIRERDSASMLERRTGLTPRMLRVSVGTEDPDWLIDRYKEALS
ncbi:MAG TPA: PLP-dependent transferase [Candidatus Saccharimonadales bacterium]|nr:PLP-dependent transferase [Candidatus Saccharimonadales bacterium]